MPRIMIMFSLVMCSGWLPAAENLPRKEVYKRVAPSTLLVRVGDSFGSAFIVDRDRRLAITNQHVTDFQGVVEVVFPEIRAGKVVTEADHYRAVKTHRAEVVDVDAARDLALLRIIDPLPETAIGLRFATELPDPGEKVISVGNPGASNGFWVLTSGEVRAIVNQPIRSGGKVHLIETQAPINPGDSGGPVVNEEAMLVGVVRSFHREGRLVSQCVAFDEVKAFIGEAEKSLEVKTPQALLARAKARKAKGLWQGGVSDLNVLGRSFPRDPEISLLRGMMQLQLKNYDRAIIDFTRVITLKPNDEIGYYERGRAYMQSGDYDAALDDLKQAVRIDEKDPNACAIRAIVNERLGKHAEALADYDRSIELKNDIPIFYFNKGDYLDSIGQYSDAEKCYDESLRLDPNHLDSYLFRARCRLHLGHVSGAAEDIDVAQRLAPGNPVIQACLADVYYHMGKYDRARELNDSILTRFPSIPEALLVRAKVLMHDKKYDQAIEAFERLEQTSTMRADLLISRGFALRLDGRYDEAMVDYKTLEKMHDYSAKSKNYQGLVLYGKKDIDGAILAYSEALAKSPGLYFAYSNRAKALLEKGEKNKALDDLNKAVELNGKYIVALKLRAKVYRDLGDTEKAEADEAVVKKLQTSTSNP